MSYATRYAVSDLLFRRQIGKIAEFSIYRIFTKKLSDSTLLSKHLEIDLDTKWGRLFLLTRPRWF